MRYMPQANDLQILQMYATMENLQAEGGIWNAPHSCVQTTAVRMQSKLTGINGTRKSA